MKHANDHCYLLLQHNKFTVAQGAGVCRLPTFSRIMEGGLVTDQMTAGGLQGLAWVCSGWEVFGDDLERK